MRDYLVSSIIQIITFFGFSIIAVILGLMGHELSATLMMCIVYAVTLWSMGLSAQRMSEKMLKKN